MRKHSPCMSSDMGVRGGAGIGMPLMAAASPMTTLNRLAIRRGFSLGTTVAVEALGWENPDAESTKTSSKEATSSTSNEVIVTFDVQNPGLNVDGLGEDHRRRKEVPGEELPLQAARGRQLRRQG